jgi:UDP-glucose 4-epimerase
MDCFAEPVIGRAFALARGDVEQLRCNAPQLVRHYVPNYEAEYTRRGWTMMPGIDRVYVNDKARTVMHSPELRIANPQHKP